MTYPRPRPRVRLGAIVIGAFVAVAAAIGGASAQNGSAFLPMQFTVSEFRDFARLETACAEPAASSFLCSDLEQVLTRIPTKGVDLFFTEAGEVAAAFAKFQKGQRLSNYNLDNADNLIPRDAAIPGGAVLLDGDYVAPEGASGTWARLSEDEFEGRFTYVLDGLEVEKRVVVSNVSHSLRVEVRVQAPADGAGDARSPETVQYAFPGIGRQQQPTIKIGQAGSFSLNPISQPVQNPSYVSLQSAANNTGNATILRPDVGGDPLAAISLGDRRVAMQAPFEEGGATLAVQSYLGKNELVRYYQEEYADLPGLFTPNILGRMSLWVLIALEFIHSYVPSWGLSIIVLTLGFRVLVWPLITTQTRSMFGMQKLQPEMKKLQTKYKDDREKLSQEMMKLYKEAGVNPAGGCLPILLQMPLFIILWRVFVNFEFAEGFLWIPDLGTADPLYILPALYVAVMLAQSWYSARGNPMMLRQAMIINVVFVFIIVNFPAGVLLYFVVSMLVQVFQYWLLSRGNPPPVPAGAKG
ncbi:MAG: membrane protein insertase YidC [Trueperaceae bacterium]|nr:membrane protein insertase YidC [Trueperaceae bacterium]